MNISIRRAQPADLPGIQHCLRDAFEAFRAQYTAAAFNDTVPDSGGLQARLLTMTCLVACDSDGEIVGTVSAQVLANGEGHLRGMAVRPNYQGSDTAARLLSAAEKLLRDRGCALVSLDTTQVLTRAIAFYERHGFVASGRVQDFFGMPLYEYKKDLKATDRA